MIAERSYTLAEWEKMLREPVLDKRYLETALGPDIADFLSWCRNEKGRAERGVDTYERDLARLAMLRPVTAANEITKDDIRAARDLFPPASRRRSLGAFRSFFRWLYREERIDQNPAERVDFPQPGPKPIHRLWTEAEDARLVAAGPRTHLGRGIWVRDRVGVLLLLRTGIRKEELRVLQVGDIDTIERLIVVRWGKGAKSRVVAYAEDGDLDKALRTYMTTLLPRFARFPDPEDYLNYGFRVSGRTVTPLVDRPFSGTGYQGWWKLMCQRAGVRYRSGHNARHTIITEALRVKGEAHAKKLAGHASIKTTVDQYGHLDVEDVRGLVETLEQRRREAAAK